jgi:hypothetical protein
MFIKQKIEKATNQQMYTRYLLFKACFLPHTTCARVQHATTAQRIYGCMQQRHTPILVYRPCARARRGNVEVHHVPERVTCTHLMV